MGRDELGTRANQADEVNKAGQSNQSARVVRPSAMVSASRAGELNRARVLRTLYAHGPMARPELARLTGSTRATIGQIVQPLLDEGVLQEQVPIASGSRGGKPARPVWFSDDGWPVAVVLLLPGGAQAALVTASGRITSVASVKFGVKKFKHATIASRLIDCLNEVIESATAPPLGVGIAVGGVVDTQAGAVVRVGLAPWLNGLEIAPQIAGSMGLPTYVDHQPRAQALGDLLFGAGRGEESFCSVYLGEGIGAGFIQDGLLHRGSRGAGGEVGHTVVDLRGDICTCGLRGCWETVASARWLRAEAAARGLDDAPTIRPARLAAMAQTDPIAAELLQELAANLAVGIINIQHSLGFNLFILHGDLVAAGESFRRELETLVRKQAFTHPGGPVRILFADIEDYATVRGAAAMVLSKTMSLGY